MTRKTFEAKAIRAAEQQLRIPPGWWGTYRDVQGPEGERVRFSGSYWVARVDGVHIGRYDSRSYAITKAKNWRKK